MINIKYIFILVFAFCFSISNSQETIPDSVYVIKLVNKKNNGKIFEVIQNSSFKIKTNNNKVFKTKNEFTILENAIVFQENDTIYTNEIKWIRPKVKPLKTIGLGLFVTWTEIALSPLVLLLAVNESNSFVLTFFGAFLTLPVTAVGYLVYSQQYFFRSKNYQMIMVKERKIVRQVNKPVIIDDIYQ